MTGPWETTLRILATACLIGTTRGGEAAEPDAARYRPENPFIGAEVQTVAIQPDGRAEPVFSGGDSIGQAEPANPFTRNFAQTRWEFSPPPAPSPESSPTPSSPARRPKTDAETQPLAESIAPWNPAPPQGVQICPPGRTYPSVRLTGFFQADSILFDQDDANKASVGDVPNGADFRRARLAATGDVTENVGYMIELDFAFAGRPSFMDVYMDLKDISWLPGTVRIGQWRQPFGMTSLTSVWELPFLERSLPQALVPFRQIGIGLIDPNPQDDVTWAISGFRFPTDPFGDNTGDSGGISLATRETLVIGGETEEAPLLHIGGDYSYLNSSVDRFAFRSQPEIGTDQLIGASSGGFASPDVPFFVDTGEIIGEQSHLFGAELAGRSGSFWAQGETFFATVDQYPAHNPAFWGGYLQAGWILTGEVKPYSRADGVFTRVVPERPVTTGGGMGAWELAGRLSTIDVTDENIEGGRLTNLTAGLNWYFNQRTKFQFNYIHAFLERAPVGDSGANILAARAQVDF